MKLICCPSCGDVVRLIERVRTCRCGQSWGQYHDEINATYGGKSIPLGFNNGALKLAVQRRPARGMGERFEAFVIPVECDTFKQEVATGG